MTKTYIVVGASRGIGAAVAKHLCEQRADVLAVSRTESRAGQWIEADVSTDAGLDRIVSSIGARRLDGLLYLGGVWERGAFTDRYDFLASTREEARLVLNVNLIAPILLAHGLASNLAKSDDPRIVLMGSVSGLDNFAPHEVANTASKFGLRGAAQSLAFALNPIGVGVTVINPGNVGTPEVEQDIADGSFEPQTPIPMSDIVRTIDFILSTTSSATPSEINLTQRRAGG